MKKIVLTALLCLAVFALAGCEVSYYHEESSLVPTEDSAEDSVPAYVFGENGFYDSVNDVEFLRADGVFAKQKGDAYITFGEYTLYKIEGAHESYLLCDENGSVFKNRDLPWTVEPDAEGFAEAYPALTLEDGANADSSAE